MTPAEREAAIARCERLGNAVVPQIAEWIGTVLQNLPLD